MAVRPDPGCAVFPLDSGGEIILHRRDCISGMQDLVEPESVDVVVTSPPYNLGVDYASYDDKVPRTEYLDWIEAWGDALLRVLSRRGSLFLNVSGKPSQPWGPFEILQRLRSRFALQNTLHWIKSIAIDTGQAQGTLGGISDSQGISGGSSCTAGSGSAGDAEAPAKSVTAGHYKPINSRRYVNDCHEYIFHLTRFGDVELDRLAVGVEYQDKSNVGRWSGAKDDLRCRGNTWFIPYRTIQSRDRERPHPATFPVRVPEMCIRLHGLQRVDRVMDPFLGLGHTALACKGLGLSCLGFELDEGYFSEACNLLKAFDPETGKVE